MKRILLVDDDPHVRRMLLRLLSGTYGILEAGGSSEALRLVAEGGVDGILLDAHLGAESGWNLLAALDKEAAPPVVMMTGDLVGDAEREQARARGALDIIQKPFDRASILRLAAASFG